VICSNPESGCINCPDTTINSEPATIDQLAAKSLKASLGTITEDENGPPLDGWQSRQ